MTKKERVKSINRFRSSSFDTKKFLSVFSVHFLILVLLFAFCIPLQYVHAIGSPSFWSSRFYVMGLIEDGDEDAGIKGPNENYIQLGTSDWTAMTADLESGNFLLQANLFTISGTPLQVEFLMTYSHINADIDIGMGKGWTSNLHTCVSEDSQSHDLTYINPTGAKMIFDWDSNSSVYVNPYGFAGKAEKLGNGTYKITKLNGQNLTFNTSGKLTEVATTCGSGKLTISYDGSGRPETLTDYLSGREITLTWSTGGKLTAVTDPMNHEWGFTYDTQGNQLIEIVKPGGTTIKCLFEYDTNHKMVAHTDFDEHEFLIDYYISGTYTGLLHTWTQPTTAVTDFSYDSASGYASKTTVTDGESHETSFYFGSNSHYVEKISNVVDTTELKTEYVYNSSGFLSTQKDSYGNETTFVYDSVGHLLSVTYPPPSTGVASYEVVYAYYPTNDLFGKLVQSQEKVTSSVWAVTTYEYEDNNAPCLPSTITDPSGRETIIAYNSDGLVAAVTKPTSASGSTTKTVLFEYDSNRNLVSTTDAEGNETTFTVNNNGETSVTAQYEGTYENGVLKNRIETTLNSTDQVTDTENTVTGATTATTINNNGEMTAYLNETGCETSYNYEFSESAVYNNYGLPPGVEYYCLGGVVIGAEE